MRENACHEWAQAATSATASPRGRFMRALTHPVARNVCQAQGVPAGMQDGGEGEARHAVKGRANFFGEMIWTNRSKHTYLPVYVCEYIAIQ